MHLQIYKHAMKKIMIECNLLLKILRYLVVNSNENSDAGSGWTEAHANHIGYSARTRLFEDRS